jgi:hypothetical protein
VSSTTGKAEASHFLGRIPDALAALREAEALVETFEGRCWRAELYRLRGVILAAMRADETQIEASFCEAGGCAHAVQRIKGISSTGHLDQACSGTGKLLRSLAETSQR